MEKKLTIEIVVSELDVDEMAARRVLGVCQEQGWSLEDLIEIAKNLAKPARTSMVRMMAGPAIIRPDYGQKSTKLYSYSHDL